eukprot:scaffold6799_cov17-Tisochrysis_lutea.AAC.1
MALQQPLLSHGPSSPSRPPVRPPATLPAVRSWLSGQQAPRVGERGAAASGGSVGFVRPAAYRFLGNVHVHPVAYRFSGACMLSNIGCSPEKLGGTYMHTLADLDSIIAEMLGSKHALHGAAEPLQQQQQQQQQQQALHGDYLLGHQQHQNGSAEAASAAETATAAPAGTAPPAPVAPAAWGSGKPGGEGIDNDRSKGSVYGSSHELPGTSTFQPAALAAPVPPPPPPSDTLPSHDNPPSTAAAPLEDSMHSTLNW